MQIRHPENAKGPREADFVLCSFSSVLLLSLLERERGAEVGVELPAERAEPACARPHTNIAFRVISVNSWYLESHACQQNQAFRNLPWKPLATEARMTLVHKHPQIKRKS